MSLLIRFTFLGDMELGDGRRISGGVTLTNK